ncbi:MAG: aldehyde dehydrogenase family protein [Phycisphaerales bacterium]|nr:MAG: aldehyde dehydrogenase family protein [Phycisphaerales bacterium]
MHQSVQHAGNGEDRQGRSAWAVLPVRDRIAWVRRFRRQLADHADTLSRTIAEEVGKTEFEALTGDVMPLLACCRWIEKRGRKLLRPRRVRGGAFWQMGQRHEVHREPLGHVAIIATWNYPVQLLGIQIVHALAAGNRVTVKPSEHSPRAQATLIEMAQRAGLPRETLSMTEATREAGAAMLREQRFDHIIFTGSTGVGRAIAEHAATTLTPTTLELSGRDSAFVLADADVELAAKSIWNGVTMNGGQTCMAPRRVLVERSVYRRFLDALAPHAASARPRKLISPEAAARVQQLAQDAIERGGRSLSGMAEPAIGATMHPIAIADCPADAALVTGDHFGPAVAILPVNSIDEALSLHRRCTQHLATSIFSGNPRRAKSLAARCSASIITINDCILPTAHPAVTLAGAGESGWGVSRGEAGLLAMTRPVQVAITRPRLRPDVQLPTRKTARLMQRFVRWWYGSGSLGSLIGADPPPADRPLAPMPPASPVHPSPEEPARATHAAPSTSRNHSHVSTS